MSDKDKLQKLRKGEESMKVGEFYKSIYNHYVSKVVKVDKAEITLENMQGVTDVVAIDNFDANWKRCATIYEFRNAIDEAFEHVEHTTTFVGETVKVVVDEDYVHFSIEDDMLKLEVSDDVKDALELDYNIGEFLLEDALQVINTVGSLFE